MNLTPNTLNTLTFAGAAYALTGALIADLSGNYATAIFGLIGLIPLVLRPNQKD